MKRKESFWKNKLSIIDKIIYYFRVKKIERKYDFTNKSIIDFWCWYNAKFLSYINEKYTTKKLIAFDLLLNKKHLESIWVKCYEWDLNNEFTIKEDIDITIGTAILEHLSNPICFLKSCYKILPEWWYLLLTVPSVRSKPILEFMAYKLKIIDKREIEDHKKYYKKESLVNELLQAWFKKENIKHSYFEFFMNNFVLVKK